MYTQRIVVKNIFCVFPGSTVSALFLYYIMVYIIE